MILFRARPQHLPACLLGLLLFGLQTAAADDFDASIANEELDALKILIELEDPADSDLQLIRGRALEIKSGASDCVGEIQPKLSQLASERDLLGEVTDDIDIELWESRSNTLLAFRRAESRLKNCELAMFRADSIADRSEELLQKITRELLSRRGYTVLEVADSAPAEIGRWPALATKALQPDLKDGIQTNYAVWAMLVTTALGIAFGWYMRKEFRKGPLLKGETGVAPNVTLYFIVPLLEQAPLLLGAVGASLAISSLTSPPHSEAFLLRLSISLLAYGLLSFLINWATSPLSPVQKIRDLETESLPFIRKRLRLVVAILLLTMTVMGPGWLADQSHPEQQLLRTMAVLLVVYSLFVVHRIAGSMQSTAGRLRILRLAFFLALLFSLGAELAGYRNLANYILRGLVLTSTAAAALWILLWQTVTVTEWLDRSDHQAARFMRTLIGVPDESRRAALGLYQLVLDTGLWALFLGTLISVWDTSNTVLSELIQQTTEGIQVGDITIIPADILGGILMFVIVIVVTGWVKRWIDRRWLQHITSDRGTRDAFITVVGYLGFMIAFIVGLSIAGVNITGLAVVAGALSVGIGFGLQAIANNFVSGIILLFERPIKAGDFVSVGDIEGFVKRISIRSTEIETLDNQDVLVPNSELISGRVTNWVLHNPYGRLRLPVGVAYGTDIEKVKEILETVACEHPEVITDGRAASPKALFMAFGDSALEFELRVRILRIPKRFDVTSELNFAINAGFKEAGIHIPFPQRDLHVKSLPEGMPVEDAKKTRSKKKG